MGTLSFHLSRDEVRELDRRAIQEYGMPGVVLMENAGRGAAELLLQLLAPRPRFGEWVGGRGLAAADLSPPTPLSEAERGEQDKTTQRHVLILCGPGNNGGDGFVMARHLQNRGIEVDVLLFGSMDRLSPDAKMNALVWQKSAPLWTVETKQPLDVDIRRIIYGAPGWIVDALFGTGLTRPLGPPFDEVVASVNASGRPVLAVDIPSGLDCDTGEPIGPTIRAPHTATFVALKKGFLNPNAAPWLGQVHILDIGAPKKLVDEYRILSPLSASERGAGGERFATATPILSPQPPLRNGEEE